MLTKVLAGLLAAVTVTAVGLTAAYSDSIFGATPPTGSLPVSEGGCCAKKFKPSCCAMEEATQSPAPSEAAAACGGSALMGLPKGGIGCCDE